MHRIRALIQLEPKKAKEEILSAFNAENAHFNNTATKLGTTYRSLYRWVEELGLEQEIARIRKKKIDAIRARRFVTGSRGGRPTNAELARRGRSKSKRRAT